ncbi:hypothetical protein [Alloacidobacterium sp.]|uniref:hypothetical protein n=1 Tax=Alloacidobacterium sp. TaxID=2951999 RepID=UPI002D515D87|nr:hypothetical protein [Alloacidobacterium sp.]HYK34962.1 hypothetical protein [Alloacidobacterium sp.]
MRRITVFCLALILFATPKSMFAQQDSKPAEPPAHYYQLSFSVQEVGENGKITNSRAYTTSIETRSHDRQSIRTGDKVPVKADDKGNLQYIDLGVNIDCWNAQEINGKLAILISANVSSTAKTTNASDLPPVIRQNQWSANALVPIGKPTVIFSSDNLQDKDKIQVELTATRID